MTETRVISCLDLIADAAHATMGFRVSSRFGGVLLRAGT